MAAKQTVLLLGATGTAGTEVLSGLLADDSFHVIAFTRPASATSPAVAKLRERGVSIRVGEVRAPVADLVPHLKGIDILVSALGPNAQLAQLNWVDAAKEAGTKRFVPCGFTTISPRGGAMLIRDEKEQVHDRIFFQKVPFTIIDVGFWHQLSFPWLPSGKADYAITMFPVKEIYGDGNAPNLLTDMHDQGRFVARIIKDPRTLNKRVVTYSDELSQSQLWEIAERLSGETIPRNYVSKAEAEEQLRSALEAVKNAPPGDWMARAALFGAQYNHSKFIRGDNTLENAKYLGYLDARELYPDFKPVTFEDFMRGVLAGKATKAYGGQSIEDKLGGRNAFRVEDAAVA
ncbi:uncharacterized protein HMPREF1541_03744 [Cyphellophora europaea CBS 101466]|uniref:NmrA-like domain-containing protein n=1 Tax=Cyphellophora europaea (strain CBS 101466) TaxID=1220924 RepID=W2RZD3_CYPE1|nr:uncharacterized protein HMPREF1541_03744 [Cyphellophora europaea CBS 101466]ETN41807.1 hypothetical protein HMPREF1541_03744 [Cyphellophora europaea CBS 101466]